jgi:hypothetical protein
MAPARSIRHQPGAKKCSVAKLVANAELMRLSAYEVLHDNSYLRVLGQKLARDGVLTVGDLTKLSSSEILEKYETSSKNVARIKSILSNYGLSLRPT